MQLKTYQQKALEQLDRYLEALKEERLKSEKAATFFVEQNIDAPEELKNYPRAAWQTLTKQGVLSSVSTGQNTEIPDPIPRTATSGDPIPHVCLKVPTGGGKTLLGVAALERIQRDPGFGDCKKVCVNGIVNSGGLTNANIRYPYRG